MAMVAAMGLATTWKSYMSGGGHASFMADERELMAMWSHIVIDRSSSNCSFISRTVTVPVCSSNRSANVLFPWSMCAMMQKLRMCFDMLVLVLTGCVARDHWILRRIDGFNWLRGKKGPFEDLAQVLDLHAEIHVWLSIEALYSFLAYPAAPR